MPTIGDLQGVRKRLGRRLSVATAPVARHDFDLGMRAEPGFDGGPLSIGQERHDTPPLQIPDCTEPNFFRHVVAEAGYTETWVEGFDVFHNPRALHPLEDWMMSGASHHWLLPDKQMRTTAPEWQPLGSMTSFRIDTREEKAVD